MTLNEYEIQLDMLANKISLQGDKVMLNFSKPFSIPLSDCTNDADLITQVRWATVKLLDELSTDLTYIAHVIIKTARAYKIAHTEAEKLYAPHVIEVIHDAIRCPSALLRFDRSFELVGHNGIEFHRDREPLTTVKAGKVRLTRPSAGHGGYSGSAAVRGVDVVTTNTHIVFSFPSNMSWSFPSEAGRGAPIGRSSRIALRHKMSSAEVNRVIDDTRSLFDGLDFSYTAL